MQAAEQDLTVVIRLTREELDALYDACELAHQWTHSEAIDSAWLKVAEAFGEPIPTTN